MKLKINVALILGVVLLLVGTVQMSMAAKTVFSDGNPAIGVKGTKVTAAYLNAVNKHYCTGLDVDGDCSLAYGVATGTNALVLTLNPALTQYVSGMPITLKTAATNTGAMTLNINGLGAIPIYKVGGTVMTAMVAGDVPNAGIITVCYHDGVFDLQSMPGKAYDSDKLDSKHAGGASGVATLDANTRVVEAANTVWDGTAGRSASPTATGDTVPVRDASGILSADTAGYLNFGTEYNLSSAASVTITATGTPGTTLISQSLGSVVAGQRYVISASAWINQTTNASYNYLQIERSGTANVTWAVDGSAGTIGLGCNLGGGAYSQPINSGSKYFCGLSIVEITDSGTLTLNLVGIHSAATTVAYDKWFYIARLK